jgi:hypothetical protein
MAVVVGARLWLLLAVVHTAAGVDRGNFKTCDQAAFCKRNRAMEVGFAGSHSIKFVAHKNAPASQASPLCHLVWQPSLLGRPAATACLVDKTIACAARCGSEFLCLNAASAADVVEACGEVGCLRLSDWVRQADV